jgi:hypothetical protein
MKDSAKEITQLMIFFIKLINEKPRKSHKMDDKLRNNVA